MRPGGNKYGARKADCRHGHTHDSGREAKRCNELHILEQQHVIGFLKIQPRYEFIISGKPVKMKNGQTARFTPDFSYVELRNMKAVAEDSKGMITEAYRLRAALFRHLNPMIELREI